MPSLNTMGQGLGFHGNDRFLYRVITMIQK